MASRPMSAGLAVVAVEAEVSLLFAQDLGDGGHWSVTRLNQSPARVRSWASMAAFMPPATMRAF